MKTIVFVRAVSLLALVAVGPARLQTRADDWPHFSAHDRAPAAQGLELVDDLTRARKVFETTDLHTGVGKALYGRHQRRGEELGIDVLPGGTSSPVVADGTIFVSYYRPQGEPRIPGAETTFRTLKTREGWNPDIWSIGADDCLLAVDAKTGKRRWIAEHPGGLNRVSIKRNDWGPAPCWHDGRVFFLGTTARVFAHDARTGKLQWDAETPAHAKLEAARAKAFDEKTWGPKHGLHTGCVVAGGVLVVPAAMHEGLVGFDVETGEERWSLVDAKQPYQSDLATPRVWRHGGREYLLAISRSGTMSLVDPQRGDVLWRHEAGGTNHGTVPLDGDVVLLNVRDQPEDVAKGATSWGAYRLSPKGPERLWTLPDEPGYWHQWKHDNGPRPKYAVRDGIAWLTVGDSIKDLPLRLLAVETETGKILSETEFEESRVAPLWIEDKLLLGHDMAHGHPLQVSWWTADPEGPQRLNPKTDLPVTAITGYLVPMETPYVEGRLFVRTFGGAACLDLRRKR